MQTQLKLKNTIKYPTSLIVNGLTSLGLEVAESLMEQGGYVIIVDAYSEENIKKLTSKMRDSALVSFLDYAAIPHLEEDLRRLDYVFYFAHEGLGESEQSSISTQKFLKYSNYLDSVLALATQFTAKVLLTTSIRSHLRLMDSMDIEVNYGKGASAKHNVYTDMEVQRYAESLTLEYVNKVNLDGRILRVGEIIGDGMDFSRQTSFTRLVVEAVVGEDLQLKEDGLNSEWYVHLMDAAYGIVRAQFTKDIKGEIYSVCYENEVTDLSLAYKLQELEPNAQEISFVQEEKSIAPLKLHKPAANLAKIGWKPRVGFEQAVAESLTAAKQLALDVDRVESAPEGSVVAKLKSFLTVAKPVAQEDTPAVDEGGPVSRLIAERKKQEQARQVSMQVAEKQLKLKRNRRSLGFGDRLNRWIFKNFFDTRTSFALLKSITPAQFVVLLITAGVGLYLYFSFIAPAVVIARNMFIIDSTVASLDSALQSRDMLKLQGDTQLLADSFAETSRMLDNFSGLAGLVAADAYLTDIQELLEAYTNYAKGANNIARSLVPFQEYLGVYSTNIRFRPSSDNYVSLTTGPDYSTYLDELNSRRVFAQLGLETMQRAGRELFVRQLPVLPAPINNYIQGINSSLREFDNLAGFAGLGVYSADLLGTTMPRRYLFFVLDNSRPMPIGGNIAAYVMLTFQNGSLADARVQPIDVFNPDMQVLADYAKVAINANTFSPLSTFRVSDLARISDPDLFADVAKDIWQSAFSVNIDMVGLVDLEAISRLLLATGPINLEGQPIDSSNLLSALASLQTDNATVARRNDLIAQLSALVLEKTTQELNSRLYTFVAELFSAAQTKNVVIVRNDLGVNKEIESARVYGNLIGGAGLPIYVSFSSDQQVVSPLRFPSFVQNLELSIKDDSSINARLLVKFPSVANISELSVCVPQIVKDVQVSGVPSNRTRLAQANTNKCVVVNVINETEVSFDWDTLPFESSAQNEYNISVGLAKLAGSQVTSNVEISIASSLSFSEIRPAVTTVGGRVAVTEELALDQLFELVINK